MPMFIRRPRNAADRPLSLDPQMVRDLFSRTQERADTSAHTARKSNPSLWAADAVHRANNLAQMSYSLASLDLGQAHGLVGDNPRAAARALARAYAELGAPDQPELPVPCAPMIDAIATRLVALFGSTRDIGLTLSLQDVQLLPEYRRVISLIGSELIINALKYAFPSGHAGNIWVTLERKADGIEFSVTDNGVGLALATLEGQGTSLIRRLCTIVGGDLQYRSAGSGLEATISIPVQKNV